MSNKGIDEDAIVVSRYNETRHLRTQAALSKLASNVAQKLEAIQNGTFTGDSSYQRLLFGVHYQISRLESVCFTLSQEHQCLLQLKESTRSSIAETEADIYALQGQLRSARKKRSSAEIYDGVAQQVIALPERTVSRRRIAETVQEVADLGKEYEALKLQSATLKKQFGVLLQQLDEMAKNVNAALKEGEVAAVPADSGEQGEDPAALAASGFTAAKTDAAEGSSSANSSNIK